MDKTKKISKRLEYTHATQKSIEGSAQDYHRLAWKGDWEKIPVSRLTQADLEYRSISQGTILHAAARQNKLGLIPKKFHTFANYSQRDKNSQSVFEVALLYKTLWSIPESLISKEAAKLTCKGIDSRSLYSHVLEYMRDKDFPSKWLDPELLLLEEHADMLMHIHGIARRGRLHFLPKEMITEKLVKSKDCGGSTLLHYAARYEGLGVIPSEFLTKENLCQRSLNGKTPIHWALTNGKIVGQIPKGLLTKKILAMQDSTGETCLHCAVNSSSLEQLETLDPKLIDEKLLLIKDRNKKSCLDYVLDSYYTKHNINNLRICLRKLSLGKLDEILKTRRELTILDEVKHERVRRKISFGTKESNKNILEI